MKEVRINVSEIIGSDIATSIEDGDLLFEEIMKGLREEDVLVTLDFANITLLASIFLNPAIGQLYGRYDGSFLNERLKIANFKKEWWVILKRVIENAKRYFEDPEKMNVSVKEVSEDE